MTNYKQKLILAGLAVFLVVGLILALFLVRKQTRVTPKAEEAPQVTLKFNDKTPSNTQKSIDIVVTVNDPALNDPDTGAGVGIITSTISYSGDIANLETNKTSSSTVGWNIGLTKNSDGETVTLFASQNIFDTSSQPIKGSAILGTITFTLAGEQANLNYNTDAYASTSAGESLKVQTENAIITAQVSEGTTLKLVPATDSIVAGNPLRVDVKVDTNGFGIAGLEAIIFYDTTLLNITKDDDHIIKNGPFGDYRTDISTTIGTSGQISIKALVNPPDTTEDQAQPLTGQDIQVVTLVFDTYQETTDTANLEYFCVGAPEPTGDFEPSYSCDPSGINPVTGEEEGSLVSLFDQTQANFEGAGILVRVENGQYNINPPGATNTPTPTPTTGVSPTNTPTQTPTPTATPQPGQASLKIALNACNPAENDLSRPVYIQTTDSNNNTLSYTLSMGSDGTTNSFTLPYTTFTLKVMPAGHLPRTINNIDPIAIPNNQIDLTNKAFIGGNSNTVDADNQDPFNQRVETLDYTTFRAYMGKTTTEDASAVHSDFNCSGKVNILDYTSILLHWGKTTSD